MDYGVPSKCYFLKPELQNLLICKSKLKCNKLVCLFDPACTINMISIIIFKSRDINYDRRSAKILLKYYNCNSQLCQFCSFSDAKFCSITPGDFRVVAYKHNIFNVFTVQATKLPS